MTEKLTQLIYIDGNFAYFKYLNPGDRVWGDDWNDVPYEHNAGEPYEYDAICFFDSSKEGLKLPCYGNINSNYSVKDINAMAIPWIRFNDIEIWAGTSSSDFKIFLAENDIMNDWRH